MREQNHPGNPYKDFSHKNRSSAVSLLRDDHLISYINFHLKSESGDFTPQFHPRHQHSPLLYAFENRVLDDDVNVFP